jgi:hypothetical protein
VLPADDLAWLAIKGLKPDIAVERGHTCLVFHDYPLPAGYSRDTVDLLVRLRPGWPDTKPDMFWVDPPIAYTGGGRPAASNSMESYLGRRWQRFSRHIRNGWKSGDGLETWMAMIRDILTREVPA